MVSRAAKLPAKTYAPQPANNWLIVPRAEASRAVAYMGALFLTAPSLAQHAALVAMDCKDELEGHVATYRRNRELLLEALPSLGLEKKFYKEIDDVSKRQDRIEAEFTKLRDERDHLLQVARSLGWSDE